MSKHTPKEKSHNLDVFAEPTPSPWQWDGMDLWHRGDGYDPETCSDPHRYTGISADRNLMGSPIMDANKRIIAAAPELLEALRESQQTVAFLVSVIRSGERLTETAKERVRESRDGAVRAIAKAEGGS